MSLLPPPRELDLEGNLAENWTKFKQRFLIFLAASDKDLSYNDQVKTNVLLHCVGERALEVYNTFVFEKEEDREVLKVVLQKFEEYCAPRRNITYERYTFFTCSQTQENIDQYVTELRKRTQSCEFGELTSQLIRDRIICGIRDDVVRQRLLRIPDLTLEGALDVCRAAEMTKIHMEAMSGIDESKVLAVQQKPRYEAKPSQNREQSVVYQCRRCGTQHAPRTCPAYGKTCMKCQGVNHFAKCCRSRPRQQYGRHYEQEQRGIQKIHEVNELEEDLFLGALTVSSDTTSVYAMDWYEPIYIKGKAINFKLDTGAQTSVLPKSLWQELQGTHTLMPAGMRLKGYGGHEIPVIGQVNVSCEVKNRNVRINFMVVDIMAEPILGQNDCMRLGLIQRSSQVAMLQKESTRTLVKEFDDLFRGIGKINTAYQIRLSENAAPVVNAPRRIPFKIKDKLKAELDRLVDLEIIAPVNKPTEWVHNLVIIEKPDGRLRLCLDPRDLNQYIKREHYTMPTIEDVASQLGTAKYFSVLDADSGYWQIPLEELSSDMCTFGTVFGRFKFLRMPFGLASAPEIFQKTMNDLFEGLEGVFIYIDDILVWGKDKEEHDKRLKAVLQRVRQAGIKLNARKCQIGVTEVAFLGHIFSKEGLKVDPNKTEAIRKMPSPDNKKDLERILGMFTYLSKFVPQFSEKTTLLRQLLSNSVEWEWTDNHQAAFNQLKETLEKPPVLQYFDPNLPITLSVDSSKHGLGAVLIQNEKPVAYASRALTKTEVAYAQIEKELLAIVYGTEHFHQYIYGQNVVIENDHKPLQSILNKSIIHASPRLQRLMLRLQRYNFSFQYKPGQSLYLADALSRHFEKRPDQLKKDTQIHELEAEVEAQVQLVLHSMSISDEKLATLAAYTARDTVLEEVISYIKNGWPKKRSDMSKEVGEFWTIRDELTIAKGMVLKGAKIVIPEALKNDMLQRLHEGHFGICKTIQRAKDSLFWIHMRKDITDMVSTCSVCQTHSRANTKETLIPHDVPAGPWLKLGVDLCTFEQRQYLVVVDYYSKFVEVALLENISAKCVILHLKSILARHGIPITIISDNGPQFTSEEFKKFLASWEINQVTASPYHPQSNGLVERQIQTLKQILKKAQDPYLGLLEWRTTPLEEANASPSQLLMSRRLRSKVPISMELLQPKVKQHEEVRQNMKTAKTKSKFYADRSAYDMSVLRPGDNVWMRRGKVWVPAVVEEKCQEPRSYWVKTTGGRYRRNRAQLKKSKKRVEFDDLEDITGKSTGEKNTSSYESSMSENDPNVNVNKSQQQECTESMSQRQETEVPYRQTRSGRFVKTPVRFKD